jgi:hypothetical protein
MALQEEYFINELEDLIAAGKTEEAVRLASQWCTIQLVHGAHERVAAALKTARLEHVPPVVLHALLEATRAHAKPTKHGRPPPSNSLKSERRAFAERVRPRLAIALGSAKVAPYFASLDDD